MTLLYLNLCYNGFVIKGLHCTVNLCVSFLVALDLCVCILVSYSWYHAYVCDCVNS